MTASHIISGHVYDANGFLLSSAIVVLTHDNGTLSTISNAFGEYLLNLKNLPAWSVGDSISVKVSKTYYGQKTDTLTVSSAPADELNLTLQYESDIIIDFNFNMIKLNAAMLTDFQGNKITATNPLPITVVDNNGINVNTKFTQAIDYVGGQLAVYVGNALPGTGKDEAKWRIQKNLYSGNYITDVQFAGGSDAFDKVWNDRTSYSYS